MVDKEKIYANYIAESRYATIFWLFSWPIFDSHCDEARYWITALIYPWFLPYIVLKDISSLVIIFFSSPQKSLNQNKNLINAYSNYIYFHHPV